MTTLLDAIREDCEILLRRALLHKTIFMFGEDGNGKHGRNEFPIYSEISSIGVSIRSDDEDNPIDIDATIRLHLPDYDSTLTGHAITDQNLRISLNMLLKAADIDVECLQWADVSEQGVKYIALTIDVDKLLDWA